MEISIIDLGASVDRIVRSALERTQLTVHLCNTYTLSLVDRNPALRAALETASLNLPDGAPIAWFGRKRGARGPVRGPDLMRAVLARTSGSSVSHFLYGGLPGITERLVKRVQSDHPRVNIAGYGTPPLGTICDADFSELVHTIRSIGRPVIVWVGLGTPGQDLLVMRLAKAGLEVPVVPVGAAFDFIAGVVKEAPARLHGTGFEWLHRLTQEPGRLWRRYTIHSVLFLATAVRAAWRDRCARSRRT